MVLDRFNIGQEAEDLFQIINFGARELVVNELRLPENVTAYTGKRFDDEEGGLTPRIPFTTPAVVGIDRILDLSLVFDTSIARTIAGEIVLLTNDYESPELAISLLANVSLPDPIELFDATTNVQIGDQSTQQIPPAVVGERNGRTFRIHNPADTPLVITDLAIDGPFEVYLKGTFEDEESNSSRHVIQPGQSQTMRVNAVPTEVGPITGNLTIRLENNAETFQMALQSSGTNASALEVTDSFGNLALPLTVNPDGLNVGSTRPDVPLTVMFSLTNVSSTSLFLDKAPIVAGSFVLANDLSSLTVLPGSSVSFNVRMLSDTVGMKFGDIIVQTLSNNEEPSQSLHFAIRGYVFSKGNFED